MDKKILILALACLLALPVLGCEKEQQSPRTVEQLEKEIDQLKKELGEKFNELKALKSKSGNSDDDMHGLEKFRNLKPTPHKGY